MKTLLATCCDIAGHLPASHILYRAHYFIIVRGQASADMTHAQWQEETGLSYEQVKDGMRRLRERKLIDTSTVLDEQRERVIKVQLSAQTLRAFGSNSKAKAETSEGHMALQHRGSEGHMALQPEGHMALHTYIGEKVLGDKKKEISDTAPPIAEKKEVEVVKLSGKSIAEVMAQASIVRKPSTKIDDIWRQAYSTQSETKWAPSLTIKDRAVLKKIVAGMPPSAAPEVIPFIVGDWPGFIAHLKSAEGIKSFPANPTLGFLLKHVGQAYQLWYSAQTPMVATKLPPSALTQTKTATAPAAPPKPTEDQPTLADILAPYKPD